MRADWRKLADKHLLEYRHARRSVRDEKKALASARKDAEAALEAQQMLQVVAEAVQVQAHDQIAQVVARCLKSVFGPDAYDFKIEFHRLRGKTEARLRFVRDGHAVHPTGASGGGVVDLAAFALRVACLMLATPRRRKLLVLDEPFRNVHGEVYRQRTVELVETLAQDLGIQFVVVTGLDWLRPGKQIVLERRSPGP